MCLEKEERAGGGGAIFRERDVEKSREKKHARTFFDFRYRKWRDNDDVQFLRRDSRKEGRGNFEAALGAGNSSSLSGKISGKVKAPQLAASVRGVYHFPDCAVTVIHLIRPILTNAVAR